jgi:hypothetical protein
MPGKKAHGAVMRTQFVVVDALLSDSEAEYHNLCAGYHEQRPDPLRQARSHVRYLERLGYKVTIEALDPKRENSPPRPGLSKVGLLQERNLESPQNALGAPQDCPSGP